MCVDDNKNSHRILRTLLSAMRIKKFNLFLDSGNAFEMMEVLKPDILIVDLLLDQANGLDLIRKIRTDPSCVNQYLPILVLTAHTERARVEEARDAGATEILCKPITARLLYDRLVWMIERPRPFIRAKGYVGPDRRRVLRDFDGSDKRGDHADDDLAAEREDAVEDARESV